MRKLPYIEILKEELLGLGRVGEVTYKPLFGNYINPIQKIILGLSRRYFGKNVVLCRPYKVNRETRINGRDWPAGAFTMIGLKRLENIELCVRNCIEEKVEGDFIETGVWRGGAVIFMKALLEAYNDKKRSVWVADSFEGLPKPNPELYPADQGDRHHKAEELSVSLEQVQENFRKFHLLDEKVQFLKGWFRDTLPTAPIEKLAVLRLDGDMYESTMDALSALYPKLSSGGYCIIDDWGAIPACRQAVTDYRSQHGIKEPIHEIDWTGIYWRKN